MDTRKTDVSMLCPTCKFGVGQAFSVAINYDFKIVHLRCPDCGREWGTRETFSEPPGRGSPRTQRSATNNTTSTTRRKELGHH
jgi:hypothetical protein